MAYDRADWHYGGNYPPDLPPENGGTHIGMFLAWAITRGLEGEIHHEDARDKEALAAVRERRMTGREFLFKQCDEKFWETDLSDEGNAFARTYYATGYLQDYEAAFGQAVPTPYHVEDSWENFDKISRVLDRRYQEWKAGTAGR
jgi:hypothetical protein